MASGFELTGKTDLRFTETLFRVRDVLLSKFMCLEPRLLRFPLIHPLPSVTHNNVLCLPQQYIYTKRLRYTNHSCAY